VRSQGGDPARVEQKVKDLLGGVVTLRWEDWGDDEAHELVCGVARDEPAPERLAHLVETRQTDKQTKEEGGEMQAREGAPKKGAIAPP
jgi:hypothetical protein